MGDPYFTRLYDLRNEGAKILRNKGSVSDTNQAKPLASNGGCESVSNDTRNAASKEDSCESLTNSSS